MLQLSILKGLSLAFNNIFFIIAGLLGVGFVIGFHELGHFLFCKLFNIRVPSFSIGFGPRVISKKIGETEFSLSAIPLGGYVEIAGSAEVGQGEQKDAAATDERAFVSKPYYQKFLVMIGGIAFNIMFAYLAFVLLFATGLPKSEFLYPLNASSVINGLEENSPAAQHLKIGDTIISMDGKKIEGNVEQLFKDLRDKAEQKVVFEIERNNQLIEVPITLGKKQVFGATVGHLGAFYEFADMPGYSLTQSLKRGFDLTKAYIFTTFYAFKHIFSKRDTSQMAGPLRIISETVKGAQRGFKIFLIFLAIISINLGILNLLPLPILDGGQILFYTIEALIRRPLPEMVRYYIHIVTWIAVLLLTIYLSAKDLMKIIGF